MHPGYFAFVMATGIISTGTFLLGPLWLSRVLLAAASAGLVVLTAALVMRLAFFRSSVVADIQAPDRVFGFFTITAVSDYGADSFWSFCWDNSGEEVTFLFKPYGNATASTSQPHFSGTATVNRKPPVGGEAGSVFTFETRFDIVGTPTRVTV